MIAAAANLGWLASNTGARQKFIRQLYSPRETQQATLRRLLSQNADTAFGRAHGFTSIGSVAEYRHQVPLADYETFAPWLQRIKQGESNVLTSECVTHLVPTSGSSAARKLIPFTASLQREFNAAINPWVADLFDGNRESLLGPAYWSISPAILTPETELSAVPIGFEDDTSYLGGFSRQLINAAMAVPSGVRHVADLERFFLLTLFYLLRCRNLRLISVWHPSFLTLLLDRLPAVWPQLIEMLHHGRLPSDWNLPPEVKHKLQRFPQPKRARELSAISPDEYFRIWPQLQVISCWADANAAAGAVDLQNRFPKTTIQPKGLLATEAFVTLPFCDRHPVAVGSHYYEFMDEAGAVQPLEALQKEQTCEVVVTTGSGLWRYRLGDRVVVDGMVGRTPSLRFIGRAGCISDLRGEKLSDAFVATALQGVFSEQIPPRFVLLTPNADPGTPGYTLFIEGVTSPDLARQLDTRLSINPHYAWSRQLGQLVPARVTQVKAGATQIYIEYYHARGRRLGEIKIPSLDLTPGWSDRLG